VHERIDPKTIIETVKKEHDDGGQMSMFSEKKPLREAIDFYKHKEGWTNRLIAGDSLLVMNSLLEKEGMVGKVQMFFIDPPYGISYKSNFQPFVNKTDVKDIVRFLEILDRRGYNFDITEDLPEIYVASSRRRVN